MYCPNCGHEVEDDQIFCENCGQRLRNSDGTLCDIIQEEQSGEEKEKVRGGLRKRGRRTAVIAVICAAVCAVAVGVGLHQGSGGNRGATASVSSGNADFSVAGEGEVSSGSISSGQVTAGKERGTVMIDGKAVTALAHPDAFSADAGSLKADIEKPAVAAYSVSSDLSNVENAESLYLSDEVSAGLSKNGFYIDNRSGGAWEFFDTYEYNRYSCIPSFVTSDSMMHTYHLYFSYLLRNTEKNYLVASLGELTEAMLAESESQIESLNGTEWESAARRNTEFFAVGATLLDASGQVPGEVKDVVSQEVRLITEASGISISPVLGTEEDYSQYAVRGYYEDTPELQGYFRAMMWYGRVHFLQKEEDLDRSALLMVMGMKGDAQKKWEEIYSITGFFAGVSDDCGYYEYKPIADAVYGENADVSALAGDESAWNTFHAATADMSAARITNALAGSSDSEQTGEDQKGFRFMGQRFSIDEAVFSDLVYDSVGTNAAGEKRLLPNALDVPAAMGSDTALSILSDAGATDFEGYSDNMTKLRAEISTAGDSTWKSCLCSQWLYTLNPLLEEPGAGYPSFMQSDAWSRKQLQTYLGSYAELKHDTVLYSKQIMVEAGDGEERDDRGYVEPVPALYLRLKELTLETESGLNAYGVLPDGAKTDLDRLADLAGSLQTMAEKELRSENLSDDEYDRIRNFGAELEHFWQDAIRDQAENAGYGEGEFTSQEFPAAVVTDIASNAEGDVLEVGNGGLCTIYVVVPIDGHLAVTEGAVYRFYQFTESGGRRLTDSEWRQMLGLELNDSGEYTTDDSLQQEEWLRTIND